MNIFILDEDPTIAAQMLCDKHVVKMALETAQILSTINGGPYKPTHMNHPCVLWAGSHYNNYKWLTYHGISICQEYMFRYGKEHKCEEVIYALAEPLIELKNGSSEFVQCMPEEYRDKDPVTAYRNYYMSKKDFCKWTKRETPQWFLNKLKLQYMSK